MDIQRLPLVVAGKNLPCAKGTKVVGGSGFVWLSGAVGEDVDTGNIPEEAGAQAELAMENIKARLEEYGSSMQNIVHVWLYVKGQFPEGMVNDSRYLDAVKAIEGFWSTNHPEFLRGNNPPASTHLGVTSLARPTFHVEILVVAAIE
jgi:enamine deaminase RidA (YjgF/YER057c/UK114 family)